MNKLTILILMSIACCYSELNCAHAITTHSPRAAESLVDYETITSGRAVDSISHNTYFSQSSSKITEKSAAKLDRFAAKLDSIFAIDRISAVEITGSSSIDGPENYNLRLSGDRASALFLYLFNERDIDHSLISFESLGENWRGLQDLVTKSETIPAKSKALEIIAGNGSLIYKESALRTLNGGKTWRHLVSDIFPLLRYATVKVNYENHAPISQKVEFEEPDANLKPLPTPPMPICCIVT